MKTLDEIINNENYERLNGALIKRSVELAEKIRKAMNSPEITRIGDYSIRTVSSSSGFSDTALYYVNRSLEAIENRYFCNDFNCWIEAANGKDRIKFLNDAKDIINEIETIKQKRMKEVENALNATDGL